MSGAGQPSPWPCPPGAERAPVGAWSGNRRAGRPAGAPSRGGRRHQTVAAVSRAAGRPAAAHSWHGSKLSADVGSRLGGVARALLDANSGPLVHGRCRRDLLHAMSGLLVECGRLPALSPLVSPGTSVCARRRWRQSWVSPRVLTPRREHRSASLTPVHHVLK